MTENVFQQVFNNFAGNLCFPFYVNASEELRAGVAGKVINFL